MFEHKGIKILFKNMVENFCLVVSYRVISSSYTELGATQMKEFPSEVVDENRVTIKN